MKMSAKAARSKMFSLYVDHMFATGRARKAIGAQIVELATVSLAARRELESWTGGTFMVAA